MTFSNSSPGRDRVEPLRIPPPPPPAPAAAPRALHLVPEPEAVPPPPPAPPLDQGHGTTRRLERELAEMQEEVAALQELLEELPTIFERTFRGRMDRLLRQQAQLEGDNRALRQRLLAIAPGAEFDPPPLRPRGLLPASVRRPVLSDAEPFSGDGPTTGG
jgi:hypothetical protein